MTMQEAPVVPHGASLSSESSGAAALVQPGDPPVVAAVGSGAGGSARGTRDSQQQPPSELAQPSGCTEAVLADDVQAGSASSRRLDINRTLLYLCADKELPLAVRKASAVLRRDPSPSTTLDTDSVVKLLYPNGTATGANIFKVPYTVEEVSALLHEVRPRVDGKEPREQEDVGVTADQLVYSMPGARLLAACGQRYRLRDAFLACWSVMPAAE